MENTAALEAVNSLSQIVKMRHPAEIFHKTRARPLDCHYCLGMPGMLIFISKSLCKSNLADGTLFEKHSTHLFRIKEQQQDLFADRTSTHAMASNQLRLWFSAFAHLMLSQLQAIALPGTRLEKATISTLRLRLLKIAARVKISVRPIRFELAEGCPEQDVFAQVFKNLKAWPS